MKTTSYLFKIGLTVSVILAALLASGISRDHFVRSALLRKGMHERARTAVNFAQSNIEKGLSTGDDILLLIQLETLSRTEDAQSAYILDRSGKVTMHSRTSEWGREYKDAYSRAAAAATRPLFQEIPSPHSYIYTVPVSTQAVLCVSYSAQKNDEALSASSQRLIYAGFALFIILYLIFHALALLPLKKGIASLTAALKGIVPGTPSRVPKLLGECHEIGRLVNLILDNCAMVILPPEKETVSLSEKKLRAFFAKREECEVLFDAENKLVAITSSARKLFNVKDGEGRHIIEIFPPEIIAAAQEARQDPSAAAKTVFQGHTIECSTLFDDKKAPAGLLVREIPA